MTQEQLEAAAAVLEQSGNPEAAATARTAAQTAPSVPGSASNVSQGSTANNGSGAAGSNSGGSSNNVPPGGSNGGSSTPTDPNAGKTWSEAITHQEWVVTRAAWSEQVPIWGVDIICSCGLHFGSQGEWSTHNQSLGFGTSHAYSAVDIISGYTTVSHPEEGYYKTVVDRAAGWY